MATSPTKQFSLAALRPHLPPHIAVIRLRTNGTMLGLYLWVWALPTYYQWLRDTLVYTLSVLPLFTREKLDSLFSGLEIAVFLLLLYNTFEAAYSLQHPQTPPVVAVPPKTPSTPVAPTAAQRRLTGSPKTPLPKTTPSQGPTPARIPSLSFSPTKSGNSFLDSSRLTSPSSLSKSFSASQLGSSTSSLNTSYGELRRQSSIGGRALDTSDLASILADLE